MHEGCMCRWVIFEFSITSPQAESHLEHQTIFHSLKLHVLMCWCSKWWISWFSIFYVIHLEYHHLDFPDVLDVCCVWETFDGLYVPTFMDRFRCVIQSIFYPYRRWTALVPATMKRDEAVSQCHFQVRWRRFRLDWVWRVSTPHLSRRLRPIAIYQWKPSAAYSKIQGVSLENPPKYPRYPRLIVLYRGFCGTKASPMLDFSLCSKNCAFFAKQCCSILGGDSMRNRRSCFPGVVMSQHFNFLATPWGRHELHWFLRNLACLESRGIARVISRISRDKNHHLGMTNISEHIFAGVSCSVFLVHLKSSNYPLWNGLERGHEHKDLLWRMHPQRGSWE